MSKKLTRNMSDKMVAGVASGLADYFQLDVTWVRIAFALAVFFGGGGFLIYIILWIALPEQYSAMYSGYTKNYQPPIPDDYISYKASKKKEKNANMSTVGGLILVVLGSYFLMDEFDLIPDWFSIGKLWPLVFVVLGVTMLMKAKKEKEIPTETKEEGPVEETPVSEVTEDKTNENI
ncbi:PspC domain-containing protein [Pedobacter glucosidilyticus]|uniref:PspC domain-containing protein n=1 Tax=Pedobacter glucosidilyticus TaxID=1122941 RepID=UPI0026ED6256|nr:PspC domain-containing protein [Pedobacter glucosidilyticus]